MQRFGCLLLAATFLAGAGFAQPPSNADVPTAAASPACPESRPLRPPLFPVQLVREKRGGSVVLDLEVAACGRVIDASLRQRSRMEFNEAPIPAETGASPDAGQLARATDGTSEHQSVVE